MVPTVAIAALVSTLLVNALPCVQFDTAWNLYAFGGTSDVNLGQNTTWASPNPQTLTTTGRPPWTGNSSQCLLAQNNNAMYVLGADSSDLTKIYIYSFGSSSWSTQSTSGGPSNLGNSRSASVLDHDTNVVFTLPSGSGQSLYQLDMSSVTTAASSGSLAWSAVENPSFSTDGYAPTVAEASNHIHYFGVPSTPAGSADLFVVHYAFFQPTAQTYPTQNGGAAFPDTAGQAISIPNAANNVPLQMVFIPNDFSSSYVVTHWTDPGNYSTTSDAPFATSLINTTQILPAPSSRDEQASYAASDTALVQIDSAGNIYYMTSAIQADYDVASAPTWTKMGYTLAGTGGAIVSGGSNSSSASNSTASGSTSSTSSTSSSSTTSSVSSAVSSSSVAVAGGGAGVVSSSKSSATSSSSATAASATSSKAAARVTAALMGGDLISLALGFVALGAAMVL
ncbi:MAG: hypothetical protein TREMPRED_004267 [Tremellales sp. Tagirdzhanova-0007]|nr:MAG: hypothetical protein TREMPRED_004267 [Tremellales sp. Tagirdzhanova-0007]